MDMPERCCSNATRPTVLSSSLSRSGNRSIRSDSLRDPTSKQAVVSDKATPLLNRFDQHVRHYELVVNDRV